MVVLLCLLELVVPVLIKVLILLNVGLFALLALLFVHKHQFFLGTTKLLFFKFSNTVLCHFCFNITAFFFASCAVLLHCSNELLDVLCVDLVVLTAVNV